MRFESLFLQEGQSYLGHLSEKEGKERSHDVSSSVSSKGTCTNTSLNVIVRTRSFHLAKRPSPSRRTCSNRHEAMIQAGSFPAPRSDRLPRFATDEYERDEADALVQEEGEDVRSCHVFVRWISSRHVHLRRLMQPDLSLPTVSESQPDSPRVWNGIPTRIETSFCFF